MRKAWLGAGAAVLGMVVSGMAGAAGEGPGPATGTLLQAQAGDVACYLTIRDARGAEESWYAGFEVCEQVDAAGARALNRRYAFTWESGNVLHPDCQGNMDCGRSLTVMLVVRIQPVR